MISLPPFRLGCPLAALAAVLQSACTGEGSLVVEVPPALSDRIGFVEVLVAIPYDDSGDRDRCGELERFPDPLDVDLERAEWRLTELGLAMDAVATAGLDARDPSRAPRLGRLPNGAFVLARARDEACVVRAEGCVRVEYGAASELQRVTVPLESVIAAEGCPPAFACSRARGGACVPPDELEVGCVVPSQCDDGRLETSDDCLSGRCVMSEDLDDDGVSAADEDGDGLPDDCDDRRATVPSEPACGAALDHDCDGVVDDLDGCGLLCEVSPPSLIEVSGIQGEVEQVFAAGDRVVTLVGGGRPALSTADLEPSGASLVEQGRVDLDLDCDRARCDLAVYGATAFVAHPDGLLVVDLASLAPGVPPAEGSTPIALGDLEEGALSRAAPVTMAVAPPLLLVGTELGLSAYDASLVAPSEGWPRAWAQTMEDLSVASLATRRGVAYAIGEMSVSLECARLPDLGVAGVSGTCFDLLRVLPFQADRTMGGRLEAVATDPAGDLFVVAVDLTSTLPHRYLYHVAVDPESGASTLVEWVEAERYTGSVERSATTVLRVVGGLLLRAGRDGLFIHDADDLGAVARALEGEEIRGLAIAGERLLVAAGGRLLVADLPCSRD